MRTRQISTVVENAALCVQDAQLAALVDADLLELVVEKLSSLGRAPGAHVKPVLVAIDKESALEERLSTRHEKHHRSGAEGRQLIAG